ncbi:MAG: hypothetical protein H6865_02395 [Rhodospirillales bacterium]|nr:hypothetical protein [Alphaproteobacteria bacterium]MCB9986465.1 hypothetical protein [Rhodospirillales bacterium]USO06990.1 MAG: hypothetical protein H6866_05990 [Rhodospirillales bacterium]
MNVRPKSTPAIGARILDLIEMFGGLADPARRDELAQWLDMVVASDVDLLAHTPEYVIHPETGLRFYPVGRRKLLWRDHARTLPHTGGFTGSRDPFGFLCAEYDDYIRAGLLYTGHLKHVDRALHDTLFSQPGLRDDPEGVLGVLRRKGILTARDLRQPDAENADRVAFVKKVNLVLAKRGLVEKYLAPRDRPKPAPKC